MRVYKPTRRDRAGKTIPYSRWYIEIRDHDSRPRKLAAFKDRQASEEFGRKLERLVAFRCAGQVPDRELSRWIESLQRQTKDKLAAWGLLQPHQYAASRLIAQMLDDWKASLVTRERTPKHVRHVVGRAQRLFDGCGFVTWSDITADAVERHLNELRCGNPAAIERHLGASPPNVVNRQRPGLLRDGISAKTSNHMLASARQFTTWVVKRGLATDEPLRVLEPLNARLDKRRIRRALTEEELCALLRAAHEGPDDAGVSGPLRAVLYTVACETGLRANELKSLRVAHLDLGEPRPSLTLQAADSKHRREDVLPLRLGTARALRELVEGRGALEPVFRLPHGWRPARMLRADLVRAAIPYTDESDRVFDFHALRGMQATRLLAAGASPKTTQTLMRHSTAELTVSLYAKNRPDDERLALDLLGDILPSPSSTSAVATGTHGDESMASSEASRGSSDEDSGGLGRTESPRDGAQVAPEGEDWWRRRESNPRPGRTARQASTCVFRDQFSTASRPRTGRSWLSFRKVSPGCPEAQLAGQSASGVSLRPRTLRGETATY